MKKATVVLLSLAIVCILILAGCKDNLTNTSDVTASAKATEKIENTHKPLSTADPTGTAQTAEPTLEPTDSTVEPTTVPTTEPTKEPTKEPTMTPTEAPTPTPTAVAKPTADPAIYPDDWGQEILLLPIKTDGKIFFWKNSRVMYTIPEGAPPVEEWYGIFSDEKNDQMIFYTGSMRAGTYTYYAIVEGEFYKISEGKIVERSMHSGKNQLWWIEDNGIAKSVNVRSSKYNEVYKEAEGVKGYNSKLPYTYIKLDDTVISPINENLLVEVKKFRV